MEMEELKSLIMEAIDKFGYTQRQLAHEIGITPTYLNQIIKDRYSISKEWHKERLKAKLRIVIDRDPEDSLKKEKWISALKEVLQQEI